MDTDLQNTLLCNLLEPPKWDSWNVTNSYSSMKLHEKLLRDPFTRSFCEDVIVKNKHLFKDKVVLDVDCGTGLIAMLIASQGAKAVIGIEVSALAELARQAIEVNNVKNIHIIQDDVDEIKSLPYNITEVDVVVSQWMGFLFFDTKLLSRLIKARDRWLKPRGILMPDSIRLFITAAECENKKKDLSNLLQLEEFNLAAFKSNLFESPQCEIIPSGKVTTDSCQLGVVNLKTVCGEKLSLCTDFKLTVLRESFSHAFGLYFEMGFTNCHKHVFISSSPHNKPTLWKQLVLYFEKSIHGKSGEVIHGTFDLVKERHHDDLHFNMKVNFMGSLSNSLFYTTYKYNIRNKNLIPYLLY